MDVTAEVSLFALRSAGHGEGPFWDSRRERLLHVDMHAGVVVDLADPEAPVRHEVGSVAAVIRHRAEGGFVLAVEHGFVLANDDLEIVDELPPILDDPGMRFNEGGCDPQGRFYCGSMAYEATPGAGTLYRMDPDRSVSIVLEGTTVSNGLQWSADGTRAFYNDTSTGRVDVFDFDQEAGTFHGRRPFAVIPESQGQPDGMAIDADGGLWIALWGGGGVHRYDPDGSLSEVLRLPVSQVTACTFGGADLKTLFITTSNESLEPGTEPEAGSVYCVEVDVAGAPPHAFAG